MAVFDALRAIRDFERAELSFIRTFDDLAIVREIGFHEEAGQPLTANRLHSLRIGAPATIKRRLATLRALGVVEQRSVDRDRRCSTLHLSPLALKACERYVALLGKLGRRRALK